MQQIKMSTALNRYVSSNKKSTQVKNEAEISRAREKSNKSTIKARPHRHSLPASLPQLSKKIIEKEEQALNYIYNSRKKNYHRNKYEIMPIHSNPSVRLQRSNSNSSVSYLSMPSAMNKPTDKYFNQLNNIKLVEKILLMKPSKEISKSTHKEFYEKQKVYRKNIRINKSVGVKKSTVSSLSQQWL